MKKNLRSKILLCVLAGGVLAANTAFAAYTETISGANDSYGTGVKSSDGNGNYTYNFNDGDSIVLTNPNSNPLTGINNSTTGSMTINGNITLSVTSTDSNQAHATGINNSKQLTIGDVTINVQANAEENGTADVKSEGIRGVVSGSLVKTPAGRNRDSVSQEHFLPVRRF